MFAEIKPRDKFQNQNQEILQLRNEIYQTTQIVDNSEVPTLELELK